MGIHEGRRKSLAILAALVLIVFAAIIGAGCNGDETQGHGTFTYAESSDPSSLDPALVEEVVGGNLVRYLFEGLVTYDSVTSEVEPAMAESWESNADATEFTFHLRSGVKFGDGSDVTAETFVYSWTRALTPETMSSTAQAALAPVKGASELASGETTKLAGVQAIDATTLKVTLEAPMADFVSLLGHPAASPVSKAAVESKETKFAENPSGNGPFRVKEWTHDDRVVLERNPGYYGAAANLDEVVVKIIPNPATAIAELKAGNVDAVRTLPPGQTEALRQDSSVIFYQGAADAVRFIAFETTKQPFDFAKVREAFAYAIDRDTIAGKLLQGAEIPADGFVPTNVPGHQNDALPYKYDPEKAKDLLGQSGYKPDPAAPLTLYYPGLGPAADVAQAVQSQLRAIGVPVEVVGLDEGTFTDQMIGGSFSLFLISWIADAPNADGYLFPLFHSENIGATNVFKYSSFAVDDLLAEGRSTTDPAKRISVYNEAERKILADAPAIPLTFGQQTLVYSPQVTGFVMTPLGDFALNEITVSNTTK